MLPPHQLPKATEKKYTIRPLTHQQKQSRFEKTSSWRTSVSLTEANLRKLTLQLEKTQALTTIQRISRWAAR